MSIILLLRHRLPGAAGFAAAAAPFSPAPMLELQRQQRPLQRVDQPRV
jgi:hypothetical protein